MTRVCSECGHTMRRYAQYCANCGGECPVEREHRWNPAAHNHGLKDGPGLACPERRYAGPLIGQCLIDAEQASIAAIREARP